MAKRKAASRTARSARKAGKQAAKPARKRAAAARKGTRTAKTAGRKKTAARKTAARKTTSRSKTATSRSKTRSTGPKRPTARKAAGRSKTAQRPAPKATRTTARKTARKAAPRATTPVTGRPKNPAAPTTTRRQAAKTLAPRKAPALDRARRTIGDDERTESPPSSLDLDRSASAVRTGRREMKERYDLHTETSPALTGGDVDADWESAYSVGDEAPGGDNPTPDQDIVDEIGRAVGVQYEDNEELKGEEKIAERDRNRWELDPASAEDYPDHDGD